MPDREAVRRAIAKTLVNAGNYPHAITPYVLGRDMGVLIAAVTTEVMNVLEEEDSDEVLKRVANRAFQDGVKAAQQAVSDVLTRVLAGGG